MRRVIGVFAVALAVVAAPSFATAQGAVKTMNAAGTVASVAPDSLMVKGTGSDVWTFMVDKDTAVVAKGATHKSLAMKADGKSTTLADFVKLGDKVTVQYHDMGSMKHALRIDVDVAAAAHK